MKRIVKLVQVIIFSAIFFSSVNAYARNKVGFINIQRIVSESKLGKKAQAEMAKIRKMRAKELRKMRQSMESLSKEIVESQRKRAQQSRIGRMVEELQQKNKEFKRYGADVKEELEKKDRALVIKILQEADPILKRIAKKKGFSIILKNVGDFAYLDPDVDLTEDILKELNR